MRHPGTPQEISTPRRENSRSLQPNGHVDVKALNVPLDIKLLIQHGDTVGEYQSDAEALHVVLSALVGAGCDDELIARLCLFEGHGGQLRSVYGQLHQVREQGLVKGRGIDRQK